jgi:hypothetical protein
MLNKDLLTHVFSFLSMTTLNSVKIFGKLGLCYYNYLYKKPEEYLLYGEVQSGKSAKILKFVKEFNPSYFGNVVKIIILQNSLNMETQMKNMLEKNGVVCKTISNHFLKENKYNIHKEGEVLLIINNRYRLNALTLYLNTNHIEYYGLILDESDQYYKRLKNTALFQNSKYKLHVTATPYLYKNDKDMFDKIIKIKPNPSYLSITNVPINIVKCEDMTSATRITKSMEILEEVGLGLKDKNIGLILINSLILVSDMSSLASLLSVKYRQIPIVVLSSKKYIIKDGKKSVLEFSNIHKLIDRLNEYGSSIIIANRYSLRGINYCNSDYNCHINLQITCHSGKTKNLTNLLQRCRILGNRLINENKNIVNENVVNENVVNKNVVNKNVVNENVVNENVVNENVVNNVIPVLYVLTLNENLLLKLSNYMNVIHEITNTDL